jgi:cytochrome b561
MLAHKASAAARAVGRLHETMEWALLIVIDVHVAAALTDLFFYRDRIFQRMLPGS